MTDAEPMNAFKNARALIDFNKWAGDESCGTMGEVEECLKLVLLDPTLEKYFLESPSISVEMFTDYIDVLDEVGNAMAPAGSAVWVCGLKGTIARELMRRCCEMPETAGSSIINMVTKLSNMAEGNR